jgi:hypothetical protein
MDQVDLSYDLNENIPNMGCHLILDFHQVTSIDMNDYNLMYFKLKISPNILFL